MYLAYTEYSLQGIYFNLNICLNCNNIYMNNDNFLECYNFLVSRVIKDNSPQINYFPQFILFLSLPLKNVKAGSTYKRTQHNSCICLSFYSIVDPTTFVKIIG